MSDEVKIRVNDSEATMQEAMKDDEAIVVGANADNIDERQLKRFLERGSKKDRRCMNCRGQVYLSPRSETVVAAMAEPRVLCLSCAVALTKEVSKDAN
jgi:hypothetical protein